MIAKKSKHRWVCCGALLHLRFRTNSKKDNVIILKGLKELYSSSQQASLVLYNAPHGAHEIVFLWAMVARDIITNILKQRTIVKIRKIADITKYKGTIKEGI